MPRSSEPKNYADNPDNKVFAELTEDLGNLGVSQADLAERLGISAGQVSRIRQGKRQAILRHIKVLRTMAAERREKVLLTVRAQPFFSVAPTSLRSLGPRDAVYVFRDLLWAEALRISVAQSRINVSLNVYAADGGIDASILGGRQIGSPEELLVGSSRYQIKAGDAQPWQRSWIAGEIYEKSGDLKSGVRQCLNDGGRYTLVCFGVDLLDGEIRKAVELLDGEFRACGYPNATIQVWGQTQITAFLQRFPSLCLALNGIANDFQCHEAWSKQDDMKAPIHFGPEQLGLVSHIRSCLSGGSIGHIRLLGEPGIGKTRIALEATRFEDIAPAVVYFPDGESFLRSQFLNELAQVDDSRFVVLVIDECRRKDSASIWNRLKSRQDRTRLITVDHDPDTSVDDNAEVIPVPPADKAQITEIICSYNVERHEAERWAAYCEGCPRVAHVVGANLQRNTPDLLSAPATVDIWDRFIVGYDDPASDEVRLRKLVLCYLSLFERFGFEHPVDGEARYISELIRVAEPAITWQRFQGIVQTLRGRRIVQGKRTLYITPRLLHVYLYRQFWDNFGRGALKSITASLPQSLRAWFTAMLPFAKGSQIATDEINRLLQVGGIFPNDRFEDDEGAMRWIESLAESHPQSTLTFLTRVLGKLSTDELLNIRRSRQQLVWALEKIAVWTDCFEGAANLLLRLASAETSNYGNNALEVFRNLFSLVPGMAATQASPDVKLALLKRLLASDSASIREVTLLAIETGLTTHGASRIIGPEHQGLSARIKFWKPNTYGELWGHYADLWRLLAENLATWKGAILYRLKTAIIESAWDAVCIKTISSEVLDTLDVLSRDENCDTKTLFSVITRRLRHSDNVLTDDVIRRLEAIKLQMEDGAFATKLRRYVSFVTLDDEFDGDRASDMVEKTHVKLAIATVKDPSLLIRELPWLVGEQGRQAYSFGFQLGKVDPTCIFFDETLSAQENCGNKGSLGFLCGYLTSIFQRDHQEWERLVHECLKYPFLKTLFSDLVICSGPTVGATETVIRLCREGAIPTSRLQRWWFSRQLGDLPSGKISELIDLQIEDPLNRNWESAIQLCHSYLRECKANGLSDEYLFELLSHEGLADEHKSNSWSYYWSKLASDLLSRSNVSKWEFLRKVLLNGSRNWGVLHDLDSASEHVLTKIVESDPTQAWDVISEVHDCFDFGREGAGLSNWLERAGDGFSEASGPIRLFSFEVLSRWIDESRDERSSWIAGLLPKSLNVNDAGGALTRSLLAKYGEDRRFASALYCQFISRGWCGNESDHARRLRDEAYLWLEGEENATVRQWIGEYVESLNYQIERAEIEEEREL